MHSKPETKLATDFSAIDHVALAMPPGEEQKARDFYVGILGMEEEQKPVALAGRGGVWFRSGPVRVHLGIENNFRPAKKAHPAFSCANYDTLLRRLKEGGYETTPEDHLLDGRERCYVHDVFGNRLELINSSRSRT